jgi:hypothetical protein
MTLLLICVAGAMLVLGYVIGKIDGIQSERKRRRALDRFGVDKEDE